MPSPSAASRTPVTLRGPSIPGWVFTATSQPIARSKWAGRFNVRSRPGLVTSSVKVPGIGSSWSSALDTSRVTPAMASMPTPSGWSITRRSTPPSYSTSTNSTPIRSQRGAAMASIRSVTAMVRPPPGFHGPTPSPGPSHLTLQPRYREQKAWAEPTPRRNTGDVRAREHTVRLCFRLGVISILRPAGDPFNRRVGGSIRPADGRKARWVRRRGAG